jgi:methanogenic corrinoid protein MtbC1
MKELYVNLYKGFLRQLEDGNREGCVDMILKALEEGGLDIPLLYTEVLAPSLNRIGNEEQSQEIRIWKEHVRSSVVRTVIECCYPYVIKERNRKKAIPSEEKVVILCPDGENHELGARMAADFFTICGYNTIYIGSSTPREEFLDVLNMLRPKYAAISVTNYFNLVAAAKTIADIRSKAKYELKILAGGHAFHDNFQKALDIGADALVETFEDICSLGKEG